MTPVPTSSPTPSPATSPTPGSPRPSGPAGPGRARRHARVALWSRTDLDWSAGEVDVLIASQAEQAVALATEMGLAADDPAWLARAAGAAALRRLGEAALARDDNNRAERLLRR